MELNITQVGVHLSSRDQSRSSSRMSFVSRLTFLKCRDYPSRRDQLFFFSVEIFKIEIFQSRFIFIKIFIEIVETKSRYLNLDRGISIVETNFLKLSRFSRPSRLTFFWCWDWESQSRPRRDKSRAPTLSTSNSVIIPTEQSILYLNREIKNFGLDTMDNLDRFQKLILTDQEITISIGLEFRDPQA